MDTEPRRAQPDELATLRDLAAMAAKELQLRRAAIDAISHEQEARSLAEAEAGRVGHIAETLQNSLTPSQLPPIPGLDVAVFYQPHSADEVGGDFFDIFPVDHEGRWGVFVGDVVGKGVEAAAFTSPSYRHERDGWLGVDGLMAALEDHSVRSASEAVGVLRSVIARNGRPLRDDLVIVAVTVPREPQPDGNVTFAPRRSREGN